MKENTGNKRRFLAARFWIIVALGFLASLSYALPLIRTKDPLESFLLPEKSINKIAIHQNLTFEDLTLGDYIGKGSVNCVCYVTFPDWWYELHNVKKDETEFVMKLSMKHHECAIDEIAALKGLWENEEGATRNNITPMLFYGIKAKNPYHRNLDNPKSIDERWPENLRNRLRRADMLSGLVVPFVEFESMRKLDTLPRIRTFYRSLLEAFAFAHSMGVTMHDLSSNNVKMINDTAVIIDWNGYRKLGDPLYITDANFGQAPPEAMIEHVDGRKIKQVSISAYDVWSTGTLLSSSLLRDSGCRLMTHRTHARLNHYPQFHNYLKDLALWWAGDTTIPITDKAGDVVDLANFVGLSTQSIADLKKRERNTKIPLMREGKTGYVFCTGGMPKVFPYARGTEEDRAAAFDLAQKMLVINPLKRPDCNELLKHPFFKD